MSGIVAPRSWSTDRRTTTIALPVPTMRRGLQLALAGLWLLDGVLQLQTFMFTKAFGHDVLAASAAGDPTVVAAPITAVAHLVARHAAGANTGFALTQILLGLGIAFRPTVKAALAASIGWALAVWWLGEGLGGVLNGQAGPLAGGPGAAVLYALLAVLLWPPPSPNAQPFVAAGAVGQTRAKLSWLLLWGLLADFALEPTSRAAQGPHNLITGMADAQPAWLASIDNTTASLVAGHGLGISIGLVIVCAAIAVAVFGSAPTMRAAIIVAIALALVIWVCAQALGGVFFGGQGTDPGTGPLLVMLALAYWPFAPKADTPC
jgi:hypothetical protein